MHCMLALALLFTQGTGPDYQKMLAAAKVTLVEAVAKGMAIAKEGVAIQAELEEEKGRVVWSLDIAQGNKTRAILLDAGDGSVVEDEVEDEDHSAVAAAATRVRIRLMAATEGVPRDAVGQMVYAELSAQEGKPTSATSTIKWFKNGKLESFSLGNSIVVKPLGSKQGNDKPFTETFGEDAHDLGPTGRNPFFILEVGYTLILEGKDGGKDAKITITVLDETKTIDGVEARAVEEREEVGGQLKEVTKDYFAISKRTNNVYYFGEAVDEYKDGKVAGHPGAWLSGEKGARYGLMMLATPVLGARYYQEIAPGVAMDRAEITSLTAKFECPAGTFENVLETEETTPLEKGERETKRYARGVGLLYDGGLELTRYGMGIK